jgi:nondiscriminating glutamyl-tRNA synthetase
MSSPLITRFAPSPTGRLHLGNMRTAFFNWLAARHAAGRFVLRIEDTDLERSHAAHTEGVLADLAWLGLEPDAGPGCEDARGPYRQSERTAHYAAAYAALEAKGLVYACYCTPLELELARKAQAAAGRPPRYAGTCAALSAAEIRSREQEGRRPSLRFRIPPGRRVEFADVVRGSCAFAADDFGDFVIRRADGTPAFLFANALDDAEMAITLVLRGEDHVANTPRQLLLLEALALPAPRYGHLPLLVGGDGVPLAKRTGAASLADLRGAGYLPGAILNLLFRLGHSSRHEEFLAPMALAAEFSLEHLGRAPARFDVVQLKHWQKEAVKAAPASLLEAWVGPPVPASARSALLAAVRPNIVLPEDVAGWAMIVYGELPASPPEVSEAIAAAGAELFDAALSALARGGDWEALLAEVKARTGRKGRALYQPLRAALTHRLEGPELGPVLSLMPPERARARLAAARDAAVRGMSG